MSFVHPILLLALPLMTLPLVIHLINQNRHRSMPWGAMMFLLKAKRMTKGMARLRHILIMAMRMLAVAALIFAISRPMSSRKWAGAGIGKTDITLILLDRSVSMETQDLQTGESKRSTALRKLAQFFRDRDFGTHLVLIDGATGREHALDSTEGLEELPFTEASAASVSIPGMLESALTYLKANDAGRADVWICSDLNENDWDAGSGRWAAIREQFSQMEGVHHYVLSYAGKPTGNVSVRVANVERRQRGDKAELVMDVLVRSQSEKRHKVPVEFTVNGVRSVVEIEADTQGVWLQGHSIPLDAQRDAGWGSVNLPGDSNPQDNMFYFVYSPPAVRRTVIVSDDPMVARAFQRAVAVPLAADLQHEATVLSSSRVGEIGWEDVGLLIWHAPLPEGVVAEHIQRFVAADRVVLFVPPKQSSGRELFGTSWGSWQKADEAQGKVSWWRGDADLFAHAGSGSAMPLDELRVYSYCELNTPSTLLARTGKGTPLMARATSDRGGVYFCGTLPTIQYSSLERDGIAFYVMLQRALARGSLSLASASNRDAGPKALADRTTWATIAPTENAPLVSQRGLHAGVYRDGEFWTAINRSVSEDQSSVVPVEKVDTLFAGLSYKLIEDAIGDSSALATEVWRMFLFVMALALVFEALLSLTGKKVETKRLGDFTSVREGEGAV